MNKWHLWTSFGHMPPGGMSSWHRLINTHNEQWWQWSLSIHSPTREPRLRRQGLTTVSWTFSSQWYCLSLSGAESSLSGGDFETQGELQGHIINLLLGRLFFKNVCVAILIRWKKEATFFVILLMLYYFKKGKNATETHKKRMRRGLCSVWRRCCDWVNASKSKVSEVSPWKFSLGNAPWLGRPVEVARDQIKSLIENSQHYTT